LALSTIHRSLFEQANGVLQQRSRLLDYLLPGHAASRSLDRASCGNQKAQLQTLWQQANSCRQSPLAQQSDSDRRSLDDAVTEDELATWDRPDMANADGHFRLGKSL
jgi:hypothetical protein